MARRARRCPRLRARAGPARSGRNRRGRRDARPGRRGVVGRGEPARPGSGVASPLAGFRRRSGGGCGIGDRVRRARRPSRGGGSRRGRGSGAATSSTGRSASTRSGFAAGTAGHSSQGSRPRSGAGRTSPGRRGVDPRRRPPPCSRRSISCGSRVVGGGVVGAERGEEVWRVRTGDGGEHEARVLVLSAGCWSGQVGGVPEESRPPIRPVKGEILTLRGPADPASLRADRRGRARLHGSPRRRQADRRGDGGGARLRYHRDRRWCTSCSEAYRLIPEMAELELVEAGAGLRPEPRTTRR